MENKTLKFTIVAFILITLAILVTGIQITGEITSSKISYNSKNTTVIALITLSTIFIFILFKLKSIAEERKKVIILMGIFLIIIYTIFIFTTWKSTTQSKQDTIIETIEKKQIIINSKIKQIQNEIEDLSSELEISTKEIQKENQEIENILQNDYEEQKNKVYASYYINKTNHIQKMYPIDNNSLNVNIGYQDHMKKIKKTQEPVISNVFLAEEGFPGITIHHPIIKDKEYAGTVAYLIDLNKFGEIAIKEDEAILKDLYLIDSNNKIVYSKNKSLLTKEATKEMNNEEKVKITEKEIFFTYKFNAVDKEWKIVNIENKSEILKEKNEAILFQWLSTIVLLITMTIITLIFSYLINNTLRKEVNTKTKELKKLNKILESQVKKRTTDLENLNQNLENQVKKRTKELDKKLKDLDLNKKALLNMMEDINEANEDLRKLDKAKSEFLNIVSHELKTPLTAMIAYLEILEDSEKHLKKDEIESLSALKRNANNLKTLIGNILEIARMDSGKFELAKEKIDIKELIEETLNDIQILAKQKNINLITRIGKLPKTSVDKERIKEVINNLVSNSIKFTEKGDIKVIAEKRNNFIEIEVSDTGVGIPKEHIKDLFHAFYQVDASISRKYGGTGLGLTITKKIIEAHGGKIDVESKEGKGTTFRLTIPIK